MAGKVKTKDFWPRFWLGIAGGILGTVVLDYFFKPKCPKCDRPVNTGTQRCPHCGIGIKWRKRKQGRC